MTETQNHEPGGPDQTAKILIVDDIPANAEALCEFLGCSGYQIELAENGESGQHGNG